MSKVLARNISRKQALSYEQTVPNRLGVTSLSEINGRGAYRERYAQTKRILRGKTAGGEIRPNAEAQVNRNYTSKQKTAMRKMSPAQRAAFAKMLKRSPSVGSVRPRRHRSNRSQSAHTAEYGKGYETISWGGKKGKGKRGRKAATPPVVVTPVVSATTETAVGPRSGSKRAFIDEMIDKRGKSFRQAEALWRRTHSKKGKAAAKRPRGHRKYGRGRFEPLMAHIGSKKKRTYLYRTGKGKVRRIPTYAILGYPSRYAEIQEGRDTKGAAKYVARTERLKAYRERAAKREADKILAGRGIFTPNPAKELSWEEWRDMKANLKRSGRKTASAKSKKQTKAQKRAANKRAWAQRKRTAARAGAWAGAGPKRRRRRAAPKRKAARRVGRVARRTGGKRHLTKAHKAKMMRGLKAYRRRMSGMGKFHGLKGKRGRASRITVPARGAKRVALTIYRQNAMLLEANKRRRRRARRNAGKATKWLRPGAAKGMSMFNAFEDNRRRPHRRHRKGFRRNPVGNWIGGLKEALKIGGIVVVGYVAHRALTKVLTDQVFRKIGAFADSTKGIGAWADIIAGVVVAAAGIPLSVKLIPGESAAIGGGMAASLLHAVIIKALGQAGQPEVASYLSAYPDASAPAYRGIGSYYRFQPHQMMSGMGEYYSAGGQPVTYGQLNQAAAGMGVNPNALVTQAAAGAGEYLAYGAQGIGDYEEVGTTGVPTAVDEGIMPTLDSAEQALNVMEAAAGVGAAEIPMQSSVYPTDFANAIADEPSGSRSGVFGGGGGIFGGK